MSIIHTNLTIDDVLMDFDPRPVEHGILCPHDGIFLPAEPSLVGVGMSNNKFKQCMKLGVELFLVRDAAHAVQIVASPWHHSTSMACLKVWTQEEFNAACVEALKLHTAPKADMSPMALMSKMGFYRRQQFNVVRRLWRAT